MGIFDKLFGKKENSSNANQIRLGELYNSALNNAQKEEFKKTWEITDEGIIEIKE